jgi:hypothetical protein
MSRTWIGVDEMLSRTIELLNSDCKMPPAPMPAYWRDENKKIMAVVYGPVDRPDFVIDEAEVPY